MKLHLPTVLLAAVLACVSQPVIATETINLNTHNWDQYVGDYGNPGLSLIHISEPTRLGMISYAVFCLKKKNDEPSYIRTHKTIGKGKV